MSDNNYQSSSKSAGVEAGDKVIRSVEFNMGIYRVECEMRQYGVSSHDVSVETRMDERLVSIQTFPAAEFYNDTARKILTDESLMQYEMNWLKDKAMAAVLDRAYSAILQPSPSSRFLSAEPTLNTAVLQRALQDPMTATIKSACGGGYTPISKEEGARVVAAFEVIVTAAKQWADLTGVDPSMQAAKLPPASKDHRRW